MKRFLVNFLFAAFLAIIQSSFISSLPWHLWRLDIIIVTLVFALGLFGQRSAFYLAIALGLFADFYSLLPFGANLIFWPLIIHFAFLLQAEWLTDKSLYSYVLLTAFVFLMNFLYRHVFSFFAVGAWQSLNWNEPVYGLLVNIAASIIVFYLVQPMAANLQPFLLSRRK